VTRVPFAERSPIRVKGATSGPEEKFEATEEAFRANVLTGMNLRLSVRAFCSVSLLALAGGQLRADLAADLISKGDYFDVRLRAEEALPFYLSAEKAQPGNGILLARIARQYRYLMADTTLPEEKLRLGRIALDYSERAARAAPGNSEAQLSVAISYGKLLPLLGAKEQVEASGRIKESADKAILLDSRNDLAWHVLGRWHRVLSDTSTLKRGLATLLYGALPRTTIEESVRCFETAIEINPHRLMHYIELGRAFAQMGRDAEARRLIEKGLRMPDVEKDDPEAKRRGRETLAKLR
jgi:tetratricopeptide (TPR) repeat protein